mgnify:CR=1 FL=1
MGFRFAIGELAPLADWDEQAAMDALFAVEAKINAAEIASIRPRWKELAPPGGEKD